MSRLLLLHHFGGGGGGATRLTLQLTLLLVVLPNSLLGSESDLDCSGSSKPMRLVRSLPDSSFSASSHYAEFLPHKARIVQSDGLNNDQAWCPGNQLRTNEMREWMSFSFATPLIMNNLLTEPRLHKSVDLGEFTKQLIIQYKRSDAEEYRNYTLRTNWDGYWRSQALIKGNADLKDKRNYVPLKPPLVAKHLRIYPLNPDPSDVSVCLKLELFGCADYQGVVSYSAPVGHRMEGSRAADFSDHYYDGEIRGGRMWGGLGQLTDYVTSGVSPGADPADEGMAGLPYVGWSKRLLGSDCVELLFEFDRVRAFESVSVEANNDFRKWNTRLFSRAEVHFSIGGVRFLRSTEQAVRRDTERVFTRPVGLDLGRHAAKYLRVRLYFDPDTDWMLLSEFTFVSTIMENPPAPESAEAPSAAPPLPPSPQPPQLPQSPRPPPSRPSTRQPPPPRPDGGDIGSGGSGGVVYPPPGPDEASPAPPQPPRPPSAGGKDSQGAPGTSGGELMYIAIIVSILLGALVLMAGIGILCLRRRQLRKKQRDFPHRFLSHHQQLQQQQQLQQLPYAQETVHLDYSNGRPAVLLGNPASASASAAAFKAVGGGVVNNNNNNMGTSNGVYTSLPRSEEPASSDYDDKSGTDAYTYAATSFSPLLIPVPPPPPMTGSRPGDAAAYASTTLCGPHGHHPLQQQQQQQLYNAGLGTYARPRGAAAMMLPPMQPQQQPQQPQTLMVARQLPAPPPPPVPRFPSDLNLQGCSGNTVYACPPPQLQQQNAKSSASSGASSLDGGSASGGSPRQIEAALAALSVPSTSVVLRDRLGGGQFGEVRLAEWTPPPVSSGDSTVVAAPLTVVAKTLRPEATAQACEDFGRELRTLARLRDPNIVRVLGIVSGGGAEDSQQQPVRAILVEYMPHGDLHQFLSQRVAASAAGPEPPLSYGCLIHMAAQIASGMKYLESLHLVHRDLAARNCLLGDAFQVKISDFGMSRPVYSTDYCRLDGWAPLLPVRWMAWEAVLHGRFTAASDAWSFAVTLWELLTFCRERPFAGLSDEQVLANCHHILLCDGVAQPLPCPPLCPRELYDLMCECWQRDEACRPRFREIHGFLQRRDAGFTPRDGSLLRRLAASS